MGLADQHRREAIDHQHTESGQSADGGPESDPGSRRVGARLLPQIPEPPARLHPGVVERRELVRNRETVRVGVARSTLAGTDRTEAGSSQATTLKLRAVLFGLWRDAAV